MVKKLLIVIMSLLIVGCLEQISAEEIVMHVQENYETMQDFKGTMIITTNFQGAEEINEIEFLIKKPNKHKSMDKKRSEVRIFNGNIMWVLDANKSEAKKLSMGHLKEAPQFDYGQIFTEILKGNEIKLSGHEKIYDEDCYVLEVLPENETNFVKYSIWVEKERMFPIKIEADFGDFKSKIEYKNIDFNSGVKDNEFEFYPPQGIKIEEYKMELPNQKSIEDAQKEISFKILQPSYTAGYEFAGASVHRVRGVESISIIYKKGQEMLTITQTKSQEKQKLSNVEIVSVGENEGEIADLFGNMLLRFGHGETEIVIVAPLSREEVIKVAESIK